MARQALGFLAVLHAMSRWACQTPKALQDPVLEGPVGLASRKVLAGVKGLTPQVCRRQT
eukprot:NODE_9667_length_466_cov_3.455635_g8577_i0.p3 GENE.NODE_9667_length_466_cov_3.455635_g8577_i0~~NODE_9667_length_466_cov_3.455635_g8577_i0.p3  ORF type:complete len:59 (-),score=4.04 NODE_9667_length_466_cov_3.455635_g8577_i0:179-355(-)